MVPAPGQKYETPRNIDNVGAKDIPPPTKKPKTRHRLPLRETLQAKE